ncbi:MAG: flavodoxin [Epsilonproteobacteria bacterium]|nr:flavodoxin [Campylobacterota bacterium]
MKKAFIINGHHYYSFSKGELNKELARRIQEQLKAKGYECKYTHVDNEWNVEEELKKHMWADVIIVQSPINWMSVSWKMKKYMDEVYSAGMQGQLCKGDGRSKENPDGEYGSSGTLSTTKYMLSLTTNAPETSFNNPDSFLFQGKSIDDLWFFMHVNFRFFGMKQIPTFTCYDVLKNPTIEQDFERLKQHINNHF